MFGKSVRLYPVMLDPELERHLYRSLEVICTYLSRSSITLERKDLRPDSVAYSFFE
jgi:hypothetical protein